MSKNTAGHDGQLTQQTTLPRYWATRKDVVARYEHLRAISRFSTNSATRSQGRGC